MVNIRRTALALAAPAFAEGFLVPRSTLRPECFLKLQNNDEENSSRREFLSKAAVSAAVATTTAAEDLVFPPSANAEIVTIGANVPSSLKLPAIGLGAWAWGDSVFWGYDKKEDDELRRVFDYAVTQTKSSPVLFDTAELYGLGRSETLLGDFTRNLPSVDEKVEIASKFAAVPFRTKPQDVVKACEASVKRLGRPVDLYQIHFPNAWSNAEYWDGLAAVYEKGLVKAVGVSNYGVDAMRACHDALAKRGIPLASNQIQLSLLYQWPLKNGLVDACHELGVEVLAYSPLALGFLTGKFARDKLPSGPRKKIGEKLFETEYYNNLLIAMKDVAQKHEGATLSQVAINWTRAKKTIPIPGARTVKQVQQNYEALDWTLTAEEEKRLDDAASSVSTFIKPEMNPFPKKDINTGLIMYDS